VIRHPAVRRHHRGPPVPAMPLVRSVPARNVEGMAGLAAPHPATPPARPGDARPGSRRKAGAGRTGRSPSENGGGVSGCVPRPALRPGAPARATPGPRAPIPAAPTEGRSGWRH